MKKIMLVMLCCFVAWGCTPKANSVIFNSKNAMHEQATVAQNYNDFALNLFKKCYQEDNVLISPLSLSYALAISANGADDDTLSQIETMMGMSQKELNAFLQSINAEKNLKIASSVWFKDDADLKINDDFINSSIEQYQAQIYEAFFNQQTLKHVNSWVKDKTDGMIPEIMKELPSETQMMILNAIALNAKWKNPFVDSTFEDVFYAMDHSENSVSYMTNDEAFYLKNEKTIGIVKEYENSNLEFVAILPQMNFYEYIQQLSFKEIDDLLTHKVENHAYVTFPKFNIDDEYHFNQILKGMGMQDAFDAQKANLKKMAKSNKNLYIGEILQKTHLSVDELGTQASSVTLEQLSTGVMENKESVEIKFNQPFVYMIVEKNNHAPLFIGTVTHLN